MFKSDEPRVYRDVARAIAMCRDDFGYFGPITLSTDRQPIDPLTRTKAEAESQENLD